MITPQQRNAWFGAYLRELKKIAESTVNPWMDEIDWDDSLLEDRLTQFIHRDYLKLLMMFKFVIENHPLDVAKIDSAVVRIEDPCTITELFGFLRSVSSFGRDNVISEIKCPDGIKQDLMDALKEGNEERFIKLTQNLDLQQIRASINHVSAEILALNLQILLMEYTEPKEEEINLVEGVAEDLSNRSLEQNAIPNVIDKNYSLAKEQSTLEFDQLPSEVKILQEEYYGVVSQWAPFSVIIDACILPKEFSIFDSVFKQWQFTDISADILHLSSLMLDYQYRRIVLPL